MSHRSSVRARACVQECGRNEWNHVIIKCTRSIGAKPLTDHCKPPHLHNDKNYGECSQYVLKCVGWCVCTALTDKPWQMARELAIEHQCASLTMTLMRVHSHHCEKCKHRKHSQVSRCWQGGHARRSRHAVIQPACTAAGVSGSRSDAVMSVADAV